MKKQKKRGIIDKPIQQGVDWKLIKESQGKPKADFCEYWRCRKEERDAQRGEL